MGGRKLHLRAVEPKLELGPRIFSVLAVNVGNQPGDLHFVFKEFFRPLGEGITAEFVRMRAPVNFDAVRGIDFDIQAVRPIEIAAIGRAGHRREIFAAAHVERNKVHAVARAKARGEIKLHQQRNLFAVNLLSAERGAAVRELDEVPVRFHAAIDDEVLDRNGIVSGGHVYFHRLNLRIAVIVRHRIFDRMYAGRIEHVGRFAVEAFGFGAEQLDLEKPGDIIAEAVGHRFDDGKGKRLPRCRREALRRAFKFDLRLFRARALAACKRVIGKCLIAA